MNNTINWKGWLAILIAISLGAATFMVYPRLESDPPRIVGPAELSIGEAGTTLTLQFIDEGTGLRNLQLRMVHSGGGQVVFEENFPGAMLSSGNPGKIHEVSVDLEPRALRIADGPATLIVTARDFSLQNLGKGNRSEVGIRINVDTKAPRVEAGGGLIYIYRGGAAAATYNVSEATVSDGVRVGDRLYPGYPAPNTAPEAGKRVAFFAVAVNAPRNPKIEYEATDAAGNVGRANLRAKVFERNFSEERLYLSDKFFDRVVPPLAESVGVSAPTNVAAFQLINSEVRAKNEERIQSLIENSDPVKHWTKSFTQFANSKVMSRFAEQRRYFTEGNEISQATHYGFDLASHAKASIGAANRGRVFFAGDLGIYGNCVLVDHGMGLTSLYAHLSEITVQADQFVERNQSVGTSGATGLAGGDHLHFAILIGGTYVDPLEWWDANWIKSHVDARLQASH
ncbi:MAG: M23 family metallopeptidase [Myxococcota bacterium]